MNKQKQTNNKSIKNRIILQFSGLVTVSILVMIAFATYLVTNNMKNQAQLSLGYQADSIQHKIEQRLDYLIENTKLFAKHDLMINSLIDEDGRDVYLTPLVKNFIYDKNVITLHVVDFDGKAIFKTQDDIPQYKDSLHLRRSLAMGETTYYLEKAHNKLIVISPIKYYNTTQGSLIAEYNFNDIINKYIPNGKLSYIKLIKENRSIYSNNFNKNKNYYSYQLTQNISPIFKKLGIFLEMGILESHYLLPIKDAAFKLSYLGLFVLIIGISISYILAISVTNPILKLFNRVEKGYEDKNYEPLGTNDELEILSKSFYDRTKKLQTSEEKYLDLYNNSPDMYISVDAKTAKVTTCNKTLLEKLGYSKKDIIGKEIFELFHPDCIDDVHKAFNLFKKTGVVNNAELQIIKKDGTNIYILLNSSAIRDENGEIIYSNSTWRDITEHKEQEEILYQQSKMASMGEMIGNIAHQWRQPIAIIAMWANNMKADIEFDDMNSEKFNKYADNIVQQTKQLSQTIDDFRNFFTPNKVKSEFSIQSIINKTKDLISASFKTNNINIIEDIADIHIYALENELTQALLNIIKNAKDILITLEDRKRLIFIKVYEKKGILYIEIKDNGGGVPNDIIDKIFEPYFTTKHKSQGTGIGLYMTQSIITKHLHGKIYVKNVEYNYKNEKYKGANFIIEIPLTTD